MTKLFVIGIGYKPLEKRAREIIYASDIILASKRLAEVFKEYEGYETVEDRIKVLNNVDEAINFMKPLIETPDSGLRTMVFLASGDPMFFGIGRRIVNEFGKDAVEILPDISSVQMAFARIKEPWDNVFMISVHGGPDPNKRRDLKYEVKDIPFLLERHDKISVLTDKVNNPSVIAREFLDCSASRIPRPACKMYVCEKLGYPDERIIEGTPDEFANMRFADPNVVIIQRTEQIQPLLKGGGGGIIGIRFGLNENEIIHSGGLITKDEVRAVTIHKLRLPQRGIFWDIGAGSGSVSIETARLCPEIEVIAVEKDEGQINNIKANKMTLNTKNIGIIEGEAPEALRGLPSPDRVFIGGSSGSLKEIISIINTAMISGIIVINATKIDTLNAAINQLKVSGFLVDISQVSISRTKEIGDGQYLSALNPVFIIKGER